MKEKKTGVKKNAFDKKFTFLKRNEKKEKK